MPLLPVAPLEGGFRERGNSVTPYAWVSHAPSLGVLGLQLFDCLQPALIAYWPLAGKRSSRLPRGPCLMHHFASSSTDSYIEVLDGSRVHPETYEWARKMAVDALEYDESAEDANPAGALEEILENPERLKDLDLDAFAEELERQVCAEVIGLEEAWGRAPIQPWLFQCAWHGAVLAGLPPRVREKCLKLVHTGLRRQAHHSVRHPS